MLMSLPPVIIGVAGGSGSGKTVLMKCMVGLEEVDHGEILYGGQRFSGLDKKERKPFRPAGGESHEVYFTGDEKKPVPMVIDGARFVSTPEDPRLLPTFT